MTGSLLVLVLLCLVQAGSGEPATLKVFPGFGKKKIGKALEYYEDKKGALTIDDILRDKEKLHFKRSRSNRPSYGYSRSTYWFRFSTLNTGEKILPWILEIDYPLIDDVRVYSVREGIVTETRRGGLAHGNRWGRSRTPEPLFYLQQPPGADITWYVSVRSQSSLNCTMILWEEPEFLRHSQISQLWYGFFYGAIIVMVLYNLFLFGSLRERSYLYYSLFFLSLAVMHASMSGHLQFMTLSSSQHLTHFSTIASVCIAIILIVFFSRSFLDLPGQAPRLSRALSLITIPSGSLLLLSPVLGYRVTIQAVIILAIVTAVSLSVVSVIVMLRNYRPARFYVFAWSAFWAGSVILGLKLFGVVPDSGLVEVFHRGTALLVMILLAMGLADRIHFLRFELEDLNEKLEDRVTQRTRELHSALDVLRKKDIMIQQEFELAGNIQKGILPQTPFTHEGVTVDAYYRSMLQVGGDFYDIFRMQGGFLGILIADVSGHGMPAAFITALAKISFSEAIQRYLFPADIFVHVNNDLIQAIKTDDFVTAFFLVISPTREIFYTNASHQMGILYRRNRDEVELLDTDGLLLGYTHEADSMYQDGIDTLEFGDRIVLYTDGVTESKNREGESFSEERLMDLVRETSSCGVTDARERIIQYWQEFTSGAEQRDDVTLIIIEIDPAYEKLAEMRSTGFRLLNEGRYPEAIEILNRALAINEDDEQTNLFLGEGNLNDGNYDRAILHFERYINHNKYDAKVWLHLAQCQYHLGRYEEALNSSRKAIQIKNNFVEALEVLARSSEALGKKEAARTHWIRIHQIDPGHAEASRWLEDEK
jgi:serine phosphatase RsbU (regulator of sigma subunit)